MLETRTREPQMRDPHKIPGGASPPKLIGLEEIAKRERLKRKFQNKGSTETHEPPTEQEMRTSIKSILENTSSEAEAKQLIRDTLNTQGVNVNHVTALYLHGREHISVSAKIQISGRDNNISEFIVKTSKPIH